MRYIGNKDQIVPKIYELLVNHNLTGKQLTFFDAFCGSGAVADYCKSDFRIIVNDILKSSVIYTKGRMLSNCCNFKTLGFDPFEYINNNDFKQEGFIYKTYTPAVTDRMYFTPENGARIDYIRQQIEEWYVSRKISVDEHTYLLACLIDAVSSVSNTAGVYGAFLKKWDPRALNPIVIEPLNETNPGLPLSIGHYNSKIEDIIADVDCDILYMDPPYTQNQYGTQYHLLETLILNDEPSVSKVTGSRPVTPYRSDWSIEYKINIVFDKVIAKTKAKYIVISYNNDGFLSPTFIQSVLKRYGKPETLEFIEIPYKKYRNWKTFGEGDHFEYLFFVEKKPESEVIYESPLNYQGNKSKMMPQIRSLLPTKISEFLDLFGGGFNVGANVNCNSIYYNDYNHFVKEIIQSLYELDTYKYLLKIKSIIKKYSLSVSNEESYKAAREKYNSLPEDKRDPQFLFTLIMYGFQQQLRFNSNHEFNNPVGNRWFNDQILEKMISFSRHIKESECHFSSKDYLEVDLPRKEGSVIYLDPPYRYTLGAYNDGKRGFDGWNKELEAEMFNYIDNLSKNGYHVILSYVSGNEESENEELKEWLSRNEQYKVIKVNEKQGKYGRREEILIVNY